jgi:hypothetical protein
MGATTPAISGYRAVSVMFPELRLPSSDAKEQDNQLASETVILKPFAAGAISYRDQNCSR